MPEDFVVFAIVIITLAAKLMKPQCYMHHVFVALCNGHRTSLMTCTTQCWRFATATLFIREHNVSTMILHVPWGIGWLQLHHGGLSCCSTLVHDTLNINPAADNGLRVPTLAADGRLLLGTSRRNRLP